ncbi:MAG: hypothetical protein U9O95_04060 [Candidatus Marinimicrobia bacterium]|nr:hypothetical protein [Candidatus Neomarinimicrobiota bacterium]
MRINKIKILVFCLLLLSLSILPAQNPMVTYDSFVHKIGMLWNNITNYGQIGDPSYSAPAPSCEWPAGSGNSYLYSGCIWLSGAFDDGGTIKYSVLNQRDDEYEPIDSIHIFRPGTRAEQETYTQYWDVIQPKSSSGDDPLGVTIKERTYAWSNPLADDFIIVEYTIKNVGLDEDSDYIPEVKRDLYDFTFTIRWDGDVAKRADWPVEDQRVNQDDHALSNADATFTISDANDPDYNGTYSGWEWVTLVPYMRRQAEREPFILDSLKTFPLDSMLTFMWDGDNLNVDAEDWGLDTNLLDPAFYDFDHLNDDFGNPDVDGSFNSAGFLGWRFLKSTKPMPPKSYVTCTIHDDPQTDAARWNDYINIDDFYNITEAVNPIYSQWQNGYFYPEDYRTFTSYGSLDTLKADDSVVVTIAYGVGGDQVNGGIYSLIELNKVMLMAQYIVDNDYSVDFDVLMAPPVDFELTEASVDGEYQGVDVKWDDLPEAHGKFGGYRVIRSNEKMPNGSFIWETLAEYEVGAETWPPSADMGGSNVYAFRDTTVRFGFDYFYCVQTISADVPGYGNISSSEALFQAMTPTSAPSLTLDNVKVVPNPYIGSAVWNNPIPSLGTSPWEHQLMFINLTADAVVRIYTLDGDFVAEVKASDPRITGPYETVPDKSGGTAIWNLVTRNNQDAAPGVYLFTVSSATAGKTTGKFVIIR